MSELKRLKKADVLHERDEAGDLIPQELELELLRKYDYVLNKDTGKKEKTLKENGPTIMAIPLSRGEIKKLTARKKDKGTEQENKDDDIIMNHCTDPKFSEKEVKALKPQEAGAIASAIMSFSLGVKQEEFANASKEILKQKMQELGDAQKKS